MKVEAHMVTMIFDRADKIGENGLQKPIKSGELVSFRVSGVQNPGVSGEFMFPLVQTQAFDGTVLDEASERVSQARRRRTAHAALLHIVDKKESKKKVNDNDKDMPEWQRRQNARDSEDQKTRGW